MESGSRQQYPIGTVARRTGLSPHVLRAWERRYAVVDPARSEGGQRLYSNRDVLRFRLLRQLSEAGHSIGQIARLPLPQLRSLLEQEKVASATGPAQGPAERYVGDALAAVAELDERHVHATLMRALVALPSHDFLAGVILPLLRQVGELWDEGEICPAHEHVLSVQVGRVLGWLATTMPVAPEAPQAVAVTPAGQRHEFGALMAGVVAAEEGWRVTYLGADLPASDIAAAVEARQAGLLLLSVVLPDRARSLLAELREIRAAAGTDLDIFVGGRGAEPLRVGITRLGARWLPDLEELRSALRELGPVQESA